jgi:predicted ATP-grasp superfamily ATP-dependent carboligase
MEDALLRDLRDLPGVEVSTMRDPRLARTTAEIEVHVPLHQGDAARLFDRCVDGSDATWIVAPETDGILERLSARVLARNRILLGSRPDAIQKCASKRRTAEVLARHRIPVVPAFEPQGHRASFAGPAVLKPADGAGCVNTRVYRDLDRARAAWQAAGRPANLVLQPFVNGEPASLSLLARAGDAVILSVNRQCVVQCGESLRFLGCHVNGLASWQTALAPLARSIAGALPGLWGYVGVDFILTAAGPIVLEINPRLTTSYAGLRRAVGANPAALVLGLLDEHAPIPAAPAALHAVEIVPEAEYVP